MMSETIVPSTIPSVKKTPTKIPTCSLLSSGTLDGAQTAIKVPKYPLVKPNRDIFTILNQSASSPNNPLGGTLQTIKNDVTTKITLPYERMYVSFNPSCANGYPPNHLPIVSNTLKMKTSNNVYHDSLVNGLVPLKNFKFVSQVTPGQIARVIKKIKHIVDSGFQARIKLCFIIIKKATNGDTFLAG